MTGPDLIIYKDYTANSHVVSGECLRNIPFKDQYMKQQMYYNPTENRNMRAITYHPFMRCGKGWLVTRKDDNAFNDLITALNNASLTFEIRTWVDPCE